MARANHHWPYFQSSSIALFIVVVASSSLSYSPQKQAANEGNDQEIDNYFLQINQEPYRRHAG